MKIKPNNKGFGILFKYEEYELKKLIAHSILLGILMFAIFLSFFLFLGNYLQESNVYFGEGLFLATILFSLIFSVKIEFPNVMRVKK